ncbi:hypothetical protein OQA88_9559 [Cercophora sp. LCS_1]
MIRLVLRGLTVLGAALVCWCLPLEEDGLIGQPFVLTAGLDWPEKLYWTTNPIRTVVTVGSNVIDVLAGDEEDVPKVEEELRKLCAGPLANIYPEICDNLVHRKEGEYETLWPPKDILITTTLVVENPYHVTPSRASVGSPETVIWVSTMTIQGAPAETARPAAGVGVTSVSTRILQSTALSVETMVLTTVLMSVATQVETRVELSVVTSVETSVALSVATSVSTSVERDVVTKTSTSLAMAVSAGEATSVSTRVLTDLSTALRTATAVVTTTILETETEVTTVSATSISGDAMPTPGTVEPGREITHQATDGGNPQSESGTGSNNTVPEGSRREGPQPMRPHGERPHGERPHAEHPQHGAPGGQGSATERPHFGERKEEQRSRDGQAIAEDARSRKDAPSITEPGHGSPSEGEVRRTTARRPDDVATTLETVTREANAPEFTPGGSSQETGESAFECTYTDGGIGGKGPCTVVTIYSTVVTKATSTTTVRRPLTLGPSRMTLFSKPSALPVLEQEPGPKPASEFELEPEPEPEPESDSEPELGPVLDSELAPEAEPEVLSAPIYAPSPSLPPKTISVLDLPLPTDCTQTISMLLRIKDLRTATVYTETVTSTSRISCRCASLETLFFDLPAITATPWNTITASVPATTTVVQCIQTEWPQIGLSHVPVQGKEPEVESPHVEFRHEEEAVFEPRYRREGEEEEGSDRRGWLMRKVGYGLRMF